MNEQIVACREKEETVYKDQLIHAPITHHKTKAFD